MANYYCKYCGERFSSVEILGASLCIRHPDGPNKGRHALFEGGEQAQYTCKYCGHQSPRIATLVSALCIRHPNGPNKGRHEPAR